MVPNYNASAMNGKRSTHHIQWNGSWSEMIEGFFLSPFYSNFMLEYLTSQEVVPLDFRCYLKVKIGDNVLKNGLLHYPTKTNKESGEVIRRKSLVGPPLVAMYWNYDLCQFHALGRDGRQYFCFSGWRISPNPQPFETYFTFQEN